MRTTRAIVAAGVVASILTLGIFLRTERQDAAEAVPPPGSEGLIAPPNAPTRLTEPSAKGSPSIDVSKHAAVPEADKRVAGATNRSRQDELIARRGAEMEKVVRSQYPPLFAKLNLAPETAEQLINLMVDVRLVQWHYARTGEAMGLDPLPTDAAIRIIKQAQQPIDDEIRQLLGDEHYKRYQEYNGSLTERQTLQRITTDLRQGPSPLSDDQFEHLVKHLAEMTDQVRAINQGILPNESSDVVRLRYEALLERSRTVLSETQIAELKRLFAAELERRRKRVLL